ncbi:hypothetical protein TYRP_003781 [Tyrophagus putrescentiae]|nr:hypothetical protein TYRP_003781 [Tyrophagus putrescentiae]
MFHFFTFYIFIIIFSCCSKDLTILVDCYPVPEDNAAAAITHFSSHHQQANEEDFVSISKLQAQPVLPPSQRVLRKRAKRSLVLGGAAIYVGHRLFGRYSEGYLVDSCVSASVFAFKAVLFAGLFGLLPVAVGRQAGRYWLGHHRPPKVIEVTVDPDMPSTAQPDNWLEELLVRRHPLLFLLLFVLLNLLSTAVFTGYLQWTRQRRRGCSSALKSTGSKIKNQLKKKETKVNKITTTTTNNTNNLERQKRRRRSSPKLAMTSRRRPPPHPLSPKPKQKIRITRK